MQTRGLVILTTEGRKDLSFIETRALRHRLRQVERFTLDRSFLAFAGTATLLPRNWGVSVGTLLAIAQGDHKDRPYPRFLFYQGRSRRLRGGLRMTCFLHSNYKEPVLDFRFWIVVMDTGETEKVATARTAATFSMEQIVSVQINPKSTVFSSSKIDKKTAPAHDFFLGCDAREIDDLRRISSVEVAA